MAHEAEHVFQVPVVAHVIAIAPMGHPITLTHGGQPPWVTAGKDQLVLSCAGDDLLATVRLRRLSGPPEAPPSRPATTQRGAGAWPDEDEEPDAVIEIVWDLTAGDPFLIDVLDYGGFALPSIGVTPGIWRLRAAVWGRARAEALEEELLMQDVADLDAWEDQHGSGSGVAPLADRDGPPLGPEIWALDLWPA